MNTRKFSDCLNHAQSCNFSTSMMASTKRHSGQSTPGKPRTRKDSMDTAVAEISQSDRDFLLRRQALASAQRGEYLQAIELFDLLIKHSPHNASHYNNRGLIHYRTGELIAALADYNRAIALNPELAKVYNNRANCYIALGKLEAAIADYDKAIDLNPMDVNALLNQGITFRDLGLYESAIENFELALHLCELLHHAEAAELPTEGHLYAERGRTYHLMGDWNYAVADYQRALSKLPVAKSAAAIVSQRLRVQVETWLNCLVRPLSA
jgi:tetratricopeptide (TPR) repeat protein